MFPKPCDCATPAPRGELITLAAEIRLLNAAIERATDDKELPVVEHDGAQYRIATAFQRCFQHGGVRLYGWPAELPRWEAQRTFVEPTPDEWAACLSEYAAQVRGER